MVRLLINNRHPIINSSYLAGQAAPANHPPVSQYFKNILPEGHPNIDNLIKNPTSAKLPAFHPKFSGFIAYQKIASNSSRTYMATIPFWHPDVTQSYKSGIAYPSTHLKVHDYFIRALPQNHPNLDMILKNPTQFTFPDNHPDMTKLIEVRSRMRAGNYLTIYLLVILGGCIVTKWSYFLIKKLFLTKAIGDQDLAKFTLSRRHIDTMKNNSLRRPVRPRRESEAQLVGQSRLDPEARKRRMKSVYRNSAQIMYPPRDKNLHNSIHSGLRKESLAIPDSYISEDLSEKDKTSIGRVLTFLTRRIPRSEWTIGQTLFLILYVVLNGAAFVGSRNYESIKLAFGSLTAVNTMVLVIPATRNSLLTWFLGVSFEKVILCHRWLGKWTMILASIHGIMYLDMHRLQEYVYLTGLAAFGCGVLITMTSLDIVRRNVFNLFFYAHFSFIGFYAFSWMHVKESRPFLIAGIVFYGVDRVLRSLWTFIPRRTLIFQPKNDGVVQVRFPKNPITEILGRHGVGQYFFVNFPELSKTEWHPFSVSSSPKEDGIEMHIRALGDHTTEINNYAQRCAVDGYKPWIRFDGPYGNQDFNYRRYPVLLLTGGGIGITPIMGMLKDIYLVGNYGSETNQVTPHRIQAVNCIWVVQKEKDADIFKEELRECEKNSKLPQFPPLNIKIYVTKEEKIRSRGYMSGRPDFDRVFGDITLTHGDKTMLVFACGPSQMVKQVWDQSLERIGDGANVDFHREIFEF